MGTGPQGLEFSKKHDLDARPYALACPGFQMLDKQAKIKHILNRPLNLTSWNVLYYRLRANFDSFRSNFRPELPTKSEEEGKAVYDLGKRVTNVIHNDGLITVEFDNLLSGGGGVVHADFVVVADGAFSTSQRTITLDTLLGEAPCLGKRF
jgi:2-polyprenyl-6-methoxyphenol hydroxylase-like FAD-dependent oxidoreductase